MRRVLPARLPANFHARPRPHAGACQDATRQTDGCVPKQRCLALVDAAILEWFGYCGGCRRVCEEAVFSSSEDRIRASAASAGVAGVGLAERPIVLKERVCRDPQRRTRPQYHGMAGGVTASLTCVLFPFPSDYRLCRQPLLNTSRLPVCTECQKEGSAIRGKVCSVRGERVLSSYAEPDQDGLVRSPVCRQVRRPFPRAVHHGSYDDSVRELVHPLKYKGMRPAAAVFRRMLAEAISTLKPAFTRNPVLMIPFPLHQGRRHQRGCNQAELIARATLKTLPGGHRELRTEMLLRTRDTQPRIALTSHQRRENLGRAFAAARAEEVTGCDFLLVDDVYTNGTTVTECDTVLRRSCAVQVWVATVARTMKLASKYAEIAQKDVEVSAEASAVGAEYRFQVFKF
jgi:ComF family protein